MQISITGRQVELHPDTVTAMERRLHYALSRFDHAIGGVTVRISDINGPRGGHDKECLIVVRLRQGGEVVVQGNGGDCMSVLNQCAERVSRAVARELDRRRSTPIRAIRRRQTATAEEPMDAEEEFGT
ncbi:HPF/RaiA family ribosome-associated protein [Thermodesulfobacteriota bacterium B35]